VEADGPVRHADAQGAEHVDRFEPSTYELVVELG
jgi:hypothetical protein